MSQDNARDIEINSCRLYAEKCVNTSAIIATFALVFFSSLALVSAGLFQDQVNHEDADSPNFKIYLSPSFSLLLGLILMIYSIVGQVYYCLNRLQGKVST